MPQPTIGQILADLFGHAEHPLAGWYAGLLEGAPLFQQFSHEYRPKIRKKIRHITDADTERDLRCELVTAALLATDRRSPLSYEPLAHEPRRGPDFLLLHKGHTPVYVEVSRIRARAADEHQNPDRLAAVICGKLDQLPANSANLLVLVNDAAPTGAAAVEQIIAGLRRRADAKDDAYFAFRGLAGARVFLQKLPLLSGIFVATPDAGIQELFLHRAARRALPPDLARTIATWDLIALLELPNSRDTSSVGFA